MYSFASKIIWKLKNNKYSCRPLFINIIWNLLINILYWPWKCYESLGLINSISKRNYFKNLLTLLKLLTHDPTKREVKKLRHELETLNVNFFPGGGRANYLENLAIPTSRVINENDKNTIQIETLQALL